MANLPLAFAELIAGGIFLTAGITNTSIGDTLKGDATLTLAPFDGSSSSGSTSAGGASGGGSVSVPNTYANTKGQGGVTPPSFAKSLLDAIGAPLTAANIKSIVDWEAMEGGNWHNTAYYNPLNTTMNEPGASSMNSVGVKAYSSWQEGLQATVATLEGSGYSDIIAALKSGGGLGGKSLHGLYEWSGGGYSSVN